LTVAVEESYLRPEQQEQMAALSLSVADWEQMERESMSRYSIDANIPSYLP
jgi:hypothetical protein